AQCRMGQCGVAGCDNGWADCDADPKNGCEINLTGDTAHCGACGTICSSQNGAASCLGGACAIACKPGFANCDGDLANGCETNLMSDTANCGACGTLCSGRNGAPACSGGACAIACAAGFADCDRDPANGCEIHVAVDPLNCGAC